jgi:excisionase family DNA binding protein
MSAFPGRIAISVEEFADAIGISRTSAYLGVQRGEIPTKRIGRRLVVPLSALDTWFSDQDNPSAA